MSFPSQTLNLTYPGIIEASAGTGKTYTIAQIYLALLRGKTTFPTRDDEHGTPGEISVRDILVVTFTEAATAELRDRLQKKIRETLNGSAENLPAQERIALQLADAEFDEASVSTIHGFCNRILQDFSFECGLPPKLTPAEDIGATQLHFAARWRSRQMLLGRKEFIDIDAETISQIIGAFSKFPDMQVAGNTPEIEQIIATQALADWRNLRAQSDELSFDEVLTRVRDALRKDESLAEKIAARYKVALVDEFQDTDPVQWEIFERIFVSRKRPFFCVGDPKQAIYEFRGGDINTYRAAQKIITQTGNGNALCLSDNYRSTPEIINAFNEIFDFDKAIENSLAYIPTHYPQSKNAPGEKNPRPALLRNYFAGSKTQVTQSIHETLVNDIAECIDAGIEPKRIAVLCSKNEYAVDIRNALSDRTIPAVTTARGSVLLTPEAKDISILMDALLNPRDKYALSRAAMSSFLRERFENAVLKNDNEAFAILREQFFEGRNIWEKHGILAAFSELSQRLDFAGAVMKTNSPTRVMTNTRHILELLNNIERVQKLSTIQLAEKFDDMCKSPNEDDESQQLRIDTDAPAVQIVTMHKSKGLEYDIVFLPHLWGTDLKPNTKATFVRSVGDNGKSELVFKADEEKFTQSVIKKNLATSACLFYVALTRACSQLVVYHARGACNRKTPIDSYAQRIFEAAKMNDNASTLQHWEIVGENECLNLDPKQIARGKADTQTATFSPPEIDFSSARERIRQDAWGIFSFSKIIGEHDSAEWNIADDENPTAKKTIEGESAAGAQIYDAPNFCDLPAGAQFGTIVHEIFEKLDYRSRENLDELIDAALPQLPEETESGKEKIRALFDATLKLPIVGKWQLCELDCSRDALREMEFFFAVPERKNLYSDLNNVFTSWGGIYKQTAEFHWNNPNQKTALKIDGLMTGFIDLVFRINGRYYIVDWKTNRVMKPGQTKMPATDLEEEIVENGYALQWAIYAVALRKFLRNTLGKNYNHAQHFGGIRYIFVRWSAFYSDDAITEPMLDELESVLMKRKHDAA